MARLAVFRDLPAGEKLELSRQINQNVSVARGMAAPTFNQLDRSLPPLLRLPASLRGRIFEEALEDTATVDLRTCARTSPLKDFSSRLFDYPEAHVILSDVRIVGPLTDSGYHEWQGLYQEYRPKDATTCRICGRVYFVNAKGMNRGCHQCKRSRLALLYVSRQISSEAAPALYSTTLISIRQEQALIDLIGHTRFFNISRLITRLELHFDVPRRSAVQRTQAARWEELEERFAARGLDARPPPRDELMLENFQKGGLSKAFPYLKHLAVHFWASNSRTMRDSILGPHTVRDCGIFFADSYHPRWVQRITNTLVEQVEVLAPLEEVIVSGMSNREIEARIATSIRAGVQLESDWAWAAKLEKDQCEASLGRMMSLYQVRQAMGEEDKLMRPSMSSNSEGEYVEWIKVKWDDPVDAGRFPSRLKPPSPIDWSKLLDSLQNTSLAKPTADQR